MHSATTSFWQDTSSTPSFPSLPSDLRVDVAVIGGGITGITAAYLLAKSGQRVALLERGRLLGRDTAHTSAHLTCVTDTRLTRLVHDFGRDHGGAVWDAGLAALDAIDGHVRAEGLDCEFEWVPAITWSATGLPVPKAGPSEPWRAAKVASSIWTASAWRPIVRLTARCRFALLSAHTWAASSVGTRQIDRGTALVTGRDSRLTGRSSPVPPKARFRLSR